MYVLAEYKLRIECLMLIVFVLCSSTEVTCDVAGKPVVEKSDGNTYRVCAQLG